jgi:hypothetical protein
VFCVEVPIFLREHFNGMYRVDVYFATKQLAEIPVFVMTPILYNIVFYWMVGLNPAADRFFVNTIVTVIVTQVVVGFGKTTFTYSGNTKTSVRPKVVSAIAFDRILGRNRIFGKGHRNRKSK